MKLAQIAALTSLVVLTQGCEKTRESLAEKAGKLLESTGNVLGNDEVIVDLQESEYAAFVNQRDQLVVVTFTAEWCGPCRQLAPVMENVASEFGDTVKAGRVDVDRTGQLAAEAGVSGIPDVRFFHNGRQVHQFTGAMRQEPLRELFRKLTDEMESDTLNAPTITAELQPLARELRGVARDLQPTPVPPAPPEDKDAGNAGEAEDAEPKIRPMEKNWMPPGIERR